MYRCALAALAVAASIAPATAQQIARNFPQNALRGALVVEAPPEIMLNGRPARLAPGARIRGQDNLLQMSAALVGQHLLVNYTLDPLGLVYDVWILRQDEADKKPWPVKLEQTTWTFDPVAQTWTKP
ncbi:MAG: hypothetical protein JSR59_25085 [Proteobacteria bacterium]|nr:hypothetical protein [Pseudomonadota bacterium]